MVILFQYLQERFPVFPVLMFATGYAGLVVAVSYTANPWQVDPSAAFRLFATVTGIFVCFLLRQRMVDEFRDFKHDAKYFPNRPIQRGLVTKKQLIITGIIALAIEVLLISSIGSLAAYLPVLLFTVLMAKDFFIKPYLDHHFTTHFFTHEIFFILFGWFFISSLRPQAALNVESLLALIILVAGPVAVELVRKFKPRLDTKGNPVQDSYSVVWGRTRTILFLMLLTLLTSICFAQLRNNIIFLFAGAMFAVSIWTMQKKDAAVIGLGAGQYLFLAFLANLIW